MKKPTLKKIIEQIKKDIEGLLIQRSYLETQIQLLQEKLLNMKKDFDIELEIFSTRPFDRFDVGTFIDNELMKQKKVTSEIQSLSIDLEKIIVEITNKNIEKKKMDHLLDEMFLREKIVEEKNEMKIIDAFALYSATVKES